MLVLGNRLLSCPTMPGVDGLDGDAGYSRISIEAYFRNLLVLVKGLSGDEKKKTLSAPENLLIRSLMLPVLCRFELQERPADGFL